MSLLTELPDVHEMLNTDDVPPHWPDEPLSFPGWVAAQAAYYRSQGTSAGDWLAAEIDQLGALARCLHATSGEVYRDRLEAVERMAREEART